MRWGRLESTGIPIPNRHSQVLRAFRGSNRESQKLPGNSETRTFPGRPAYAWGLILQKAAAKLGFEADGGSWEPRPQLLLIQPSPLPGLLRTLQYSLT